MVHFKNEVFSSSIDVGKIYYFKSIKLATTNEPHYFIVIAMPSDDLIIFSCCTTQFVRRAKFIKINNLPTSTLVRIKPNKDNCLKEDTYVDCNGCFKYSKNELIQMYESNKIKFIGYIPDSKLEEIYQGLKDSPLISEDLKEIITLSSQL